MRYENDERPRVLALYLVEHAGTVRSTAKEFGISKSTVHKDITYRLKRLDPVLFAKVTGVLAINKSERHIRGGNATKMKYEFAKCTKNKK